MNWIAASDATLLKVYLPLAERRCIKLDPRPRGTARQRRAAYRRRLQWVRKLARRGDVEFLQRVAGVYIYSWVATKTEAT